MVQPSSRKSVPQRVTAAVHVRRKGRQPAVIRCRDYGLTPFPTCLIGLRLVLLLFSEDIPVGV